MKELPAPHPNKIKNRCTLSYRVQRFFCFKRSFRLYHLTNLKRNFLFLTFTFVSYTVESSYYIHIFLATHIRDAIEIIINN